ncbi:hypothetical protein DL770_005843 [Monosporascus sp. CRB-9-2]|nr:hypothetical protein DL770_005843 [Monosporascus sp. CRB-9-2]
MRLINVKTFKLEEFLDDKTPPYAILSHTWGNDCEELTFRNIEKGEIDKPGVGSVKFRGCCRQAETDGLGYAWIDTCCINKDSSRELDEAINSMFRWYRRASVCYAYLSDVPSDDYPRNHGSKFRTSRWFRRGWTLQELLAPKHLRFYNSEWRHLGTKAKLCGIVEKTTGVPRQFLQGIAELRTASVAQRMSWAAQRDTKRKEDLAYCLLGIFGVTMPMIYGEGGEQAFFRLQEQIMKTTRDDSILAWGLSAKGPPTSNSSQVTAGRILAAAPSDFANSGQIVPREQTTTPLHLLDISGGSLRIQLSLLATSSSKAIGLLNCGPEHDTQQVVGIPLAKMASGSDEYVRPEGYHSMLRPIIASKASLKLIHIKNDSQSKKSTETNQRYWSYDDDGFAEVNLDLVDVVPRSCWDEERALITSTIQSDGTTHRTLARFRHNEKGSRDFVIVLEFKQQGAYTEAQCCVIICCRNISLEELAGKLQYVIQKASGKRSASNELLHLQVTLEPVPQQPMFIIRPEAMPHPPDVTIDATVELQKADLTLELVRILEEKGQNDVKEIALRQRAKGKRNRLEQIKTEREMVEDELRKLEERRKKLVEEEGNAAEEIYHLSERQADVRGRQEHTFRRWLYARRWWDMLWYIECGEGGYELERMDGETPLRWAAEGGHEAVVQQLLETGADVHARDKDGRTALSCAAERGHEAVVQLLLKSSQTSLRWAVETGDVEVVKMLLDRGADVAVANKDGWTPLIAASSKGHVDVVRLLLATTGVNADLKDSESGQTPLSWAAANGCEAVVQLLLDTGKVDINSRDNTGRTPLQWAAERGYETIVRLLLKKGTATYAHRQTLEGHDGYVNAVAFSPDGRTLASASDSTVRLWDAASGAHWHTLEGHSGNVFAVAFSPDGRTLVSASGDKTVRLWDAASGAHCHTLEGHGSWVHAVAFSPDGRTLASASRDNTVRLWDAASGAHWQTPEGHGSSVYAVAFSPDGRTLALALGDKTVRLWDAASGAHRQTLKGHGDKVWAIAFSPDGRTFASASGDKTVRLWDAASGAHRQTLKGHGDEVWAVAFSPDGRTLASASGDNTVRLWDAASGAHRQTLEGHDNWVKTVAFSPDGRTLASASDDSTVRLWDAATSNI